MYKIIGANQVEYGPVSADQLRQWIAEGRVNAQTPVQAEGDTTWKPLSAFPEFASTLPPSSAPGPAPMPGAAPAPFGAAPGDDGGRVRAASQVSGPAISLIVATAIGMGFAVLGILMQILGLGMAGMSQFENNENAEMARMLQMYTGVMGIVLRSVAIIVGIFIILGCIKMKKLENYGMAMTVSIIAMVPCLSPCCCLGLPFGIWALVVLSKPEVKQYFT
jgi:hypothetical protein